MIECPNCGKKNSDDNKFCGECGAKLPEPKNYCPKCDKTFKKGEKFCTLCGTKLVNKNKNDFIKKVALEIKKYGFSEFLNHFNLNDFSLDMSDLEEYHHDEYPEVYWFLQVYTSLKKFEELNVTTDSIYDLKDLEVLIILDDGTNLTNWEDVEWKYNGDEKYNDNIIYISENLSNYTNLKGKYENINSLEIIVLEGVTRNITNMEDLFCGCESLMHIYTSTMWDVSNVKSMEYLFCSCGHLLDISFLKGWDVSNVENMGGMFFGCGFIDDFSSLKGWDVSNVTNMKKMFLDCVSLEDISFLKGWDVSNVTNMKEMFEDCYFKDLSPLKDWDVSNVTNMKEMFYLCRSLEDLSPLRDWNVSNVTDMSFMFSSLSDYDVSDNEYMLKKFKRFSRTPLKNISSLRDWDVSNVINMYAMFLGTQLKSISSLKNWDVSNVENMELMFCACDFKDLSPLKGWDVSNVTNMSKMFGYCESLVDCSPLNEWEVSKSCDISKIFENCNMLTTYPNWHTKGHIKQMDYFTNEITMRTIESTIQWKNCEECGHRINKVAKKCPYCGYEF